MRIELNEDGEGVLEVTGTFTVKVDVFVNEAQLKGLTADQVEPELLAEFQRLIGEQAQETIAWGETPFVVTESPIPSLLGSTFEKEKEPE